MYSQNVFYLYIQPLGIHFDLENVVESVYFFWRRCFVLFFYFVDESVFLSFFNYFLGNLVSCNSSFTTLLSVYRFFFYFLSPFFTFKCGVCRPPEMTYDGRLDNHRMTVWQWKQYVIRCPVSGVHYGRNYPPLFSPNWTIGPSDYEPQQKRVRLDDVMGCPHPLCNSDISVSMK